MRGRSALKGPVERLARQVLRRLAVGANVVAGPSLRVGRGAIVSAPHHLDIGHSVSIGPRSIVQVDGRIGDWVMIGMGVQIIGRDDHASDEVGVPFVLSTWVGDRPQRARDTVNIGRDVWVGGGSVIMSGVAIGEGSVIAAGSVVTKDIADFSIVAGTPAREIRRRFSNVEDEVAHRAALDARG